MSLDWDIKDCADTEAIKSDEEWPVTYAIIWATIGVGIPVIKEKDAEEFFRRMLMLETVNGPWLMNAGEREPVTLQMVRDRIGLRTNADRLTNKQFEQTIINTLRREADRVCKINVERIAAART